MSRIAVVLSVAFSFCMAGLSPVSAYQPQHESHTGALAPVPGDKLVYRQYLYDNGSKVAEIRFYSNIGGHGGYFQLFNMTNQNRKYRIKIYNKMGKSFGRIVHATARSSSQQQSCSSAGTLKAGIYRVHLRYSKVE